eukprot:15095831-Ditylum_brightwellii.AAC.1
MFPEAFIAYDRFTHPPHEEDNSVDIISNLDDIVANDEYHATQDEDGDHKDEVIPATSGARDTTVPLCVPETEIAFYLPESTPEDLCIALSSLLHSNFGKFLLSSPRHNAIFRKDNKHFIIALRRRLRIPIHQKAVLCRCKNV